MTVGSLFAGIGGFDLAAERVGWEVKWQVEIDPFCNRVLEKHWPHVRRYGNIRAIDWSAVEPVDLVCGGFPCQPHSLAGRRLAAEDQRDLWPEVVRCLRGTQPRWFVGENVSGLLSSDAGRFFGTVLRDLAASGFDAEWHCLPAAALGMPQYRDRVWIVANSNGAGLQGLSPHGDISLKAAGRAKHLTGFLSELGRVAIPAGRAGGIHDGVPARAHRLRALGNAIVPQVAEWIFRQIQAAEDHVTA